jgi:hypothetical protein
MEVEIGRITHYYSHLNVAVMRLNGSLKLGDKIHVLGHTSDFMQRVASMEVNHHTVEWVKTDDDVAIKVIEPVHEHDAVYRVVEESFEPHFA